ncbi:hypothetical protein M2158_009142 [Streptomyces sp. SAI-144]|uniref:hypothetical protein n=1 Tax=unclassified Streptomyces TaxID=2593676 RepID=UPI00247493AF|nr:MULTISPECIES: hypothetical protein [unclassified Streptomyces]MDH6440601.1 hypothetical protein [Streptomyces sp. SAI-144]MDH6487899.1 hypothetical protein [Streptomyces sp. SAI-127]
MRSWEVAAEVVVGAAREGRGMWVRRRGVPGRLRLLAKPTERVERMEPVVLVMPLM